MTSKTLIIILGIALLSPSSVTADEAGDAAMQFLNIGISARNSGTGGALSTLMDGPTSSYYNPAGLSETGDIQFAGMHSEWLQDTRYEYLGLAVPAGSGVLGLSMSYLGYGEIEGYSASNTAIGSISAYDWALGLAYGRQVTSGISLGIGMKSLGEKLDDTGVNGFAGDIGLQYRAFGYGLGLALVNLGPKVKYSAASSPLPARLDAGASYAPFGNDVTFLAGLRVPFHGQTGFMVGLEYTYADLLTLRSGYDSAERIDSRSGMALGAGVNILNHSLDYAYNANSLFGGTHQISFALKFGQPKDNIARIETPPNPQETGIARSENSQARKGKSGFIVCAAKYSARSDAERHIETLKKFGYSPRLVTRGLNDYRVALAKTGRLSQAEKLKAEYAKKGINCFIEEE